LNIYSKPIWYNQSQTLNDAAFSTNVLSVWNSAVFFSTIYAYLKQEIWANAHETRDSISL